MQFSGLLISIGQEHDFVRRAGEIEIMTVPAEQREEAEEGIAEEVEGIAEELKDKCLTYIVIIL